MSNTITVDELDNVIRSEYQKNADANHRRYSRVNFDGPVVLTRFSSETGAPTGASIIGRGMDISVGGMKISHEQELPGGVLAAALRDQAGEVRKVLLKPLRSTLMSDGTYVSACRFIQPQPTLVPETPE